MAIVQVTKKLDELVKKVRALDMGELLKSAAVAQSPTSASTSAGGA